MCTGPLTYIGREATLADIANLQGRARRASTSRASCPRSRPAPSSTGSSTSYYQSDEELLFAIADAMHEEYKLITDSGLNLQIDDPDLPDGWQMFPEMSVADYRAYAELRVEALNHALRGIPEEQVRLHICWGSGHGPHKNDIPLGRHRRRRAQGAMRRCIRSRRPIRATQHEWRVWQQSSCPRASR